MGDRVERRVIPQWSQYSHQHHQHNYQNGGNETPVPSRQQRHSFTETCDLVCKASAQILQSFSAIKFYGLGFKFGSTIWIQNFKKNPNFVGPSQLSFHLKYFNSIYVEKTLHKFTHFKY